MKKMISFLLLLNVLGLSNAIALQDFSDVNPVLPSPQRAINPRLSRKQNFEAFLSHERIEPKIEPQQKETNPKHLDTRYFSVFLLESMDEADLARKISGSEKWWKKFDLAEELDALYRKVLEQTDLYKPASGKIQIEFREDLDFLKEDFPLEVSSVPGAYLYEKTIIYVIAKKTNREILAHEMAHAALHAYAGVKLPRKVDEALALWVAGQLK